MAKNKPDNYKDQPEQNVVFDDDIPERQWSELSDLEKKLVYLALTVEDVDLYIQELIISLGQLKGVLGGQKKKRLH